MGPHGAVSELRGGLRARPRYQEEEEEEGLFKANAVNEEEEETGKGLGSVKP
jgi:hypothetical protein